LKFDFLIFSVPKTIENQLPLHFEDLLMIYIVFEIIRLVAALEFVGFAKWSDRALEVKYNKVEWKIRNIYYQKYEKPGFCGSYLVY
jgi:hypothetical protein